jgi:hypothetical protein
VEKKKLANFKGHEEKGKKGESKREKMGRKRVK